MKKFICFLLSFMMVSAIFSDLSAKDKKKSKYNCSPSLISSKLKDEIINSPDFDKTLTEGVVVLKFNINSNNEIIVEKIQSNDAGLSDLVMKSLNGKKLKASCVPEDGMTVKFDFRKEENKQLYYQF